MLSKPHTGCESEIRFCHHRCSLWTVPSTCTPHLRLCISSSTPDMLRSTPRHACHQGAMPLSTTSCIQHLTLPASQASAVFHLLPKAVQTPREWSPSYAHQLTSCCRDNTSHPPPGSTLHPHSTPTISMPSAQNQVLLARQTPQLFSIASATRTHTVPMEAISCAQNHPLLSRQKPLFSGIASAVHPYTMPMESISCV